MVQEKGTILGMNIIGANAILVKVAVPYQSSRKMEKSRRINQNDDEI